MKLVFEAAKQVQDFFDENSWQFCFIGGIALQRWGKPRLTNDADVTLVTGFGDEEVFIDKILERFQSRVPDGKEFALRNRVLLLQVQNIGVDVSLGAFFFEETAAKRSVSYEFIPGITLRVCSAEDLIVFKAFADRRQDWADVESVLLVQSTLDWEYILNQLTPLAELKEEPEILEKLESLRKEITGK